MLLRRVQWWRIALPEALAIAAPNILIAHAQLSAPTVAAVAFTMPVWATISRAVNSWRWRSGVKTLLSLGGPSFVSGKGALRALG